jgi:dethiobiotin synthetase
MSFFITGTDTGVGKTLVSCALLQGLASRGKSVIGMKPVAAGLDEHGQNEDVQQLRMASTVVIEDQLDNPYAFRLAIAPHLAAQIEGIPIELNHILESYQELKTRADIVVVEGVGGFRVPLNADQDSADLARLLDIPIILVVGMRLGCLNHALLSAEAIEHRGLKLAGWVANIIDNDMIMQQENTKALQQHLRAPLLGVIPFQSHPDFRYMAKFLNLNLLESCL